MAPESQILPPVPLVSKQKTPVKPEHGIDFLYNLSGIHPQEARIRQRIQWIWKHIAVYWPEEIRRGYEALVTSLTFWESTILVLRHMLYKRLRANNATWQLWFAIQSIWGKSQLLKAAEKFRESHSGDIWRWYPTGNFDGEYGLNPDPRPRAVEDRTDEEAFNIEAVKGYQLEYLMSADVIDSNSSDAQSGNTSDDDNDGDDDYDSEDCEIGDVEEEEEDDDDEEDSEDEDDDKSTGEVNSPTSKNGSRKSLIITIKRDLGSTRLTASKTTRQPFMHNKASDAETNQEGDNAAVLLQLEREFINRDDPPVGWDGEDPALEHHIQLSEELLKGLLRLKQTPVSKMAVTKAQEKILELKTRKQANKDATTPQASIRAARPAVARQAVVDTDDNRAARLSWRAARSESEGSRVTESIEGSEPSLEPRQNQSRDNSLGERKRKEIGGVTTKPTKQQKLSKPTSNSLTDWIKNPAEQFATSDSATAHDRLESQRVSTSTSIDDSINNTDTPNISNRPLLEQNRRRSAISNRNPVNQRTVSTLSHPELMKEKLEALHSYLSTTQAQVMHDYGLLYKATREPHVRDMVEAADGRLQDAGATFLDLVQDLILTNNMQKMSV